MLTVEFTTDDEARKAYLALEDRITAQHNHIACAVENPDHWGEGCAREFAIELRVMQRAATCLRKAFFEKHGYQYNIRTGDGSAAAPAASK